MNRLGINSLQEADIPYHLRNRKQPSPNDEISRIINASNPTINLIAGEELFTGNAVYVNSDGKIFKSSYSLPANAFCLGNYSIDQIATILTNSSDSLLYISDVNFEVGKKVWLCTGQPNISTDIPDFSIGHIIQKLGIAVSSNEILISIEESQKII